jgi:hypothetical protein
MVEGDAVKINGSDGLPGKFRLFGLLVGGRGA